MVLENAVSTNIILSLLGLVLFKFVESLPLRDFQTVLKSSSKLTKYHFQSFLLFTGTQTVVTFLNVHSKIVSSHARIEKTIEEQSVFLGSHVSEESKCGSFFFFFLAKCLSYDILQSPLSSQSRTSNLREKNVQLIFKYSALGEPLYWNIRCPWPCLSNQHARNSI